MLDTGEEQNVLRQTGYPKAFIVLKDGVNSDNSINDIKEYCKNNLPDYMIPEEIKIEKELPHTPRGKVDYRSLEERENKNN